MPKESPLRTGAGSNQQSVSLWISQLAEEDYTPLQKLWERYADGLLRLARDRLAKSPTQVADEDDITNSVFVSLCRAASEGRLRCLKNRDELWWLLVAMTKRKVVDHLRREMAQKRGAGRVANQPFPTDASQELAGAIELAISREPTPEIAAAMAEQYELLLAGLRDDQLRRIASLRITGYSAREIAAKAGLSNRSVERKLALIRKCWAQSLGGETISG